MTIKEAIELLLHRLNRGRQGMDTSFAAFGGTTGNLQILQKDTNAAIQLWQEKRDASGLHRAAATLYTLGNLTEAEYEQIMKALDGEK